MEWEYILGGAWQPFTAEENHLINNSYSTSGRVVLWNRDIVLDLPKGTASLANDLSSVIQIQPRPATATRTSTILGNPISMNYVPQSSYTMSTNSSSSNAYSNHTNNYGGGAYASQLAPPPSVLRTGGAAPPSHLYTSTGYGAPSQYAVPPSYNGQAGYEHPGYPPYQSGYNVYPPGHHNGVSAPPGTAQSSYPNASAVTGPPKRGTTKPDLNKASASKPLFQRLFFEFMKVKDEQASPNGNLKQLLIELAGLSTEKAQQTMKDFSSNGDTLMTGRSATLSTHCARANSTMNKEVTTQVTITNASNVPIKWSIRDPLSVRHEEFISCMPYAGELLPGASDTFDVSVVVYGTIEKPTDDVKWNRLLVVEVSYQEATTPRLQYLGLALSVNAKYESKTLYWDIPQHYLNDVGAIGKGAFASVTKVLVKGVACAKKSWKKRTADFEAELKVLTKVKHKYIVKLVGVAESKEEVSIILEHCQNGSMTEYCHSNVELDFGWATSFCRKLASAVKALHDHNFIHRDLKGMNVLVSDDREPRLIDFGVATLDNLRHPGEVAVGSKPWIAPEAFNHRLPTKASDIYSLGLVFHELTSRETPPRTFFHISSGLITDLSTHVVNYSPKLAALIVYFCCNPDPQKRPTIDVVEKILISLEQNPQ